MVDDLVMGAILLLIVETKDLVSLLLELYGCNEVQFIRTYIGRKKSVYYGASF